MRTVPARFAGPRPDSRREREAAIRERGERGGGEGLYIFYLNFFFKQNF